MAKGLCRYDSFKGWEAYSGLAEWVQCNCKREMEKKSQSQRNGRTEAKIRERERLLTLLTSKVEKGAMVHGMQTVSRSLEKARS